MIIDSVPVRRDYELAAVDTIEVSSRPLVDIEIWGDDRIFVVDEAGTVHRS